MTICKFFLQGTCKFGQTCKFEHQIGDGSILHGGGTSVLRQQVAGGNMDTATLVRSVQNDMVNAEKGGQWLLSCYAPFKDKPAFPGFEDRSFEEVRLGFYEATKNGSTDQYKQHLQLALQESVTKIKALQQPSPEIINILMQLYNTPGSGGSSPFASGSGIFQTNPSQTNVFAQNNQQSIFKPTQPGSQSIFAAANQNLFTGNPAPQNPMYSKAQSTSIFAGAPQAHSQSIFGGQSPSNQIFARKDTMTSTYSAQSSSSPFQINANNSVFSAQKVGSPSFTAAPPTNSLFTVPTNNLPFTGQQNQPFAGQQNQPFAGQQNQPFSGQQSQPFAGQQNQPFPVQQNQPFSGQQNQPFPGQQNQPFTGQQNLPSAVFVQQVSPLLEPKQGLTNLGVTQQPASPQQPQMFVPQQQTSPFGNQQSVFSTQLPYQQNTSIFNTPTKSAPLPNANVFHQQGSSDSTSIFGSTASTVIENVNLSLYSKLEDLSESDIKSFESDHFEFGKIPVKPPTIQMCF